MGSLRQLEAAFGTGNASRPRFLRARAITLNRLGLYGEALADLREALTSTDRDENTSTWLSIAQVHAWRGNHREASRALLRALSESDNQAARARILLEAGRLSLEVGRPEDAQAFLARGLDSGQDCLGATELRRARIALGQALERLAEPDAARGVLADVLHDPDAEPRQLSLASLAAARAALRVGDAAAADALVSPLRRTNTDPAAFEAIEVAELDAELARAEGRPHDALPLVQMVVARCAEDDLAGREIEARLLEASCLEELGRNEEAGRTLAAALRRAEARDLSGYVERARERLAIGGATAGAGALGPVRDSPTRFVRRRPLGSGGIGSVSRAYDLDSGLEVALKTIRLERIYDVDARRRKIADAKREADVASRIHHPGVGRVYGMVVGPDDDLTLVRELVDGPTLRERLAAPVAASEALSCLAYLGHALAAVHAAGIVHGDLKPENVVLRGGTMPVIIDFGTSVQAGGGATTSGYTAGYAAPEQVAGRAVDLRADLYAYGAIACELFLGRLPELPLPGILAWMRRRAKVALIRQDLDRVVPGPAADGVIRALSSSPRGRPRSAAELAITFGGGGRG